VFNSASTWCSSRNSASRKGAAARRPIMWITRGGARRGRQSLRGGHDMTTSTGAYA
jgi:hypothetical protein